MQEILEFLLREQNIAAVGAVAMASLGVYLALVFRDCADEFGRYDIRQVGLTYFIMLPLARRLGKMPKMIGNSRFMQNYQAWTDKNLNISGMDTIWTSHEYVGSHVLMMIFGFFFPFLFKLAFPTIPMANIVLVAFVLAALAGIAPFYYLKQTISERNKAIFHGLPYFLDLLTLLVEAGMEFTEAIKRTTRLLGRGALTQEMMRFSGELDLGRSRTEALMAMAARVDLVEMKSFATALIQQQELGSPLGECLRVQAEIMRFRRVEAAEELANKAPVKIMIPMVLFIFPSIFLIFVGPMLIRAGQQSTM